jgi:predicted small integral membrane protein
MSEPPIAILEEDVAPPKPPRRGFLPIHTNGFDRGFVAVVLFIAIHLLWMRFLEFSIPLYVATILSVVVGAIVIARG